MLDEAADFWCCRCLTAGAGRFAGPGHAIGRLGFGELRTVVGTATDRLYVDGGFAQVRGNVVTVLTSKAVAAEEIQAGQRRGGTEIGPQGGADFRGTGCATQGPGAGEGTNSHCPSRERTRLVG